MATFLKIPLLNPIRTFDLSIGDFAVNMLPSHVEKIDYCQKYEPTDNFTFQFGIIADLPILPITYVRAYIVDYQYNILKTLTVNIKLSQVVSDYTTYEINELLTGLSGLCYFYLEIDKLGLTTKILSEPIYIKTTHKDTVKLIYSNTYNEFGVIFDTLYSSAINFELRFEGGFEVNGFSPLANDVSYEDQIRNENLLSSFPFNTHKLTVGKKGVPNYLIDTINRALSCNITSINGREIVKNKGAKLEPILQDKLYPFTSWIIELCKKENKNSNELSISGSTVIGFSDNAIGFSDTVIGF